VACYHHGRTHMNASDSPYTWDWHSYIMKAHAAELSRSRSMPFTSDNREASAQYRMAAMHVHASYCYAVLNLRMAGGRQNLHIAQRTSSRRCRLEILLRAYWTHAVEYLGNVYAISPTRHILARCITSSTYGSKT